LDGWQTAETLLAIPGINGAFAGSGQNMVSFPQYAFLAQALVEGNETRTYKPLATFEPSQTLADADDTRYIFRLTAAEKSHRPASVAEVSEQVEADLRRLAAHQLAVQAAKQKLPRAAEAGVDAAADGQPVLDSGLLSADMPVFIPGLDLSRTGPGELLRQARTFLASELPPGKPVVGVVELPRDGKVLLTQIVELIPGGEMEMRLREMQAQRELAVQFGLPVLRGWVEEEAVAKRVGYVSAR
jgi:hypothetical protein